MQGPKFEIFSKIRPSKDFLFELETFRIEQKDVPVIDIGDPFDVDDFYALFEFFCGKYSLTHPVRISLLCGKCFTDFMKIRENHIKEPEETEQELIPYRGFLGFSS